MVESTLQSRRFSQAVFEIAKEHQEFDKWQKDIKILAVLAGNIEFLTVMENPKTSFADKKKLLDSQIKGISDLAHNLIFLLTSHGNFSLITEIDTDYERLLDNFKGIENAEVTTAIQLDEKENSKLREYLERMTGKKINLSVKVDPRIIGGIVARVGGKIIDGSTSSQLAELKNELANAGR